MTGNLDMNNNRVYNVAQPNGDSQPATKIWSENKFLDKSSGVMAGSLNMSNNKITHLATATRDGDATNKKYIDDNYYKLSGGNEWQYNIKQYFAYFTISSTKPDHWKCSFLYKLLIRMIITNLIWSITRQSILETQLMLLMLLISSIWTEPSYKK